MNNRSILVTGCISHSTIIAGDGNVAPPPPSAFGPELRQTLAEIKSALLELSPQSCNKMQRALDDLADESIKNAPEKDEIGAALSRALKYASQADDFSSKIASIAPKILSVADWLGGKWDAIKEIIPKV